MAGNPNGSGAVAAGINELAIKKIIDKVGKDSPGQAQLLSTVLGATVNEMMRLPGNTGSAVAVSGTKNNLYHKFFKAPIQGLNLDSLNYN